MQVTVYSVAFFSPLLPCLDRMGGTGIAWDVPASLGPSKHFLDYVSNINTMLLEKTMTLSEEMTLISEGPNSMNDAPLRCIDQACSE